MKGAEIDNCLANNIPLTEGQCNKANKLIRNIFGGSVGGPIKKDRLFLFMNVEATRRAEAASQTATVPSQALRDGVLQYQCAPILDANGNIIETAVQVCPGNTATGVSQASYTAAPGNYAMSYQQLAGIDPLGLGANPQSEILQSYPVSNTNAVGDGLNYVGFNFSAPIAERQQVYIAKLDYNITQDGKQHISVMDALNNDNNALQPYRQVRLQSTISLTTAKVLLLIITRSLPQIGSTVFATALSGKASAISAIPTKPGSFSAA